MATVFSINIAIYNFQFILYHIRTDGYIFSSFAHFLIMPGNGVMFWGQLYKKVIKVNYD